MQFVLGYAFFGARLTSLFITFMYQVHKFRRHHWNKRSYATATYWVAKQMSEHHFTYSNLLQLIEIYDIFASFAWLRYTINVKHNITLRNKLRATVWYCDWLTLFVPYMARCDWLTLWCTWTLLYFDWLRLSATYIALLWLVNSLTLNLLLNLLSQGEEVLVTALVYWNIQTRVLYRILLLMHRNI